MADDDTRAVCVSCGFEHHNLENAQYQIGQVITPPPGSGGDYGKCRRCNKLGLRITAIPEPADPVAPEGWSSVPSV